MKSMLRCSYDGAEEDDDDELRIFSQKLLYETITYLHAYTAIKRQTIYKNIIIISLVVLHSQFSLNFDFYLKFMCSFFL